MVMAYVFMNYILRTNTYLISLEGKDDLKDAKAMQNQIRAECGFPYLYGGRCVG